MEYEINFNIDDCRGKETRKINFFSAFLFMQIIIMAWVCSSNLMSIRHVFSMHKRKIYYSVLIFNYRVIMITFYSFQCRGLAWSLFFTSFCFCNLSRSETACCEKYHKFYRLWLQKHPLSSHFLGFVPYIHIHSFLMIHFCLFTKVWTFRHP